MVQFTERGNYVDQEGGLFISGASPLVKGIHIGGVKDVMSQSEAGLGTQGAIQTHYSRERLPAPKEMELPD